MIMGNLAAAVAVVRAATVGLIGMNMDMMTFVLDKRFLCHGIHRCAPVLGNFMCTVLYTRLMAAPGGFKVPVLKDHPVLGSAPSTTVGLVPPKKLSQTAPAPTRVKSGTTPTPTRPLVSKKKKSTSSAFQKFYNDGAVSDSHSISSNTTTSTIAAAAALSVAAVSATTPPPNKLRTVVTVTGSALLLAGILFAAYKAWQKVKELQEEIERVRCAADSSALCADDIEVIAREQVRQLLDEAVIVEEEEEILDDDDDDGGENQISSIATAPMLPDLKVFDLPEQPSTIGDSATAPNTIGDSATAPNTIGDSPVDNSSKQSSNTITLTETVASIAI